MSTDSLNDIYTYRELNAGKIKHEYEITVSGAHIKHAIDSELRKIAKNVKLPGFRVGKAPCDLIESNYKNEAVERVLNDVMKSCSDDLIKKNKMEDYIRPEIKIISLPDLTAEDGKSNLVYQLSLHSMPEVPLIDISKVYIKIFKLQIEENAIREFIEIMKAKFPNFISVDDPLYQAQNGNRLIIDFEGRIRGKIFKGGSNKNYTFDLGVDELIINDFGDQLIGLRKGDTKTFKLQFHEDYEHRSMAGQEADFFVRINDIKVQGKLENDDDLVKSMELANNIELIEHVKKIIDFDCSKMIELLTKKQLFDYLDAEYSFDLPEDMIKEELQRLHEEQDPKKEELQQLHEEPGHEKEAEKRVKFAMLFMKFCAEHQLKITTEDLMKTTLNYYRETQSAKNNDFEDLDEMIKFMRKNRDFLYFLEGQALEHKVINYIIERANKDQHDVSVNALRELFDNTFNKEIKSGEV